MQSLNMLSNVKLVNYTNIFKSYIQIIRPFNSLLSGSVVIIGTISAFGTTDIDFVINLVSTNYLKIFFAFLTTFLIAAGGFVINDYYDYNIDCINRPNRVLPSGKMSLQFAKYWANLLFVLGIIAAFLLFDYVALLFAILGEAGVIIYAKKFKRKKEIGNFIVAILAIIPFFYGGIIAKNYFGPFIIALITFFLIMSREIFKDIEDLPGDEVDPTLSSIPIRCGSNKAVIFADLYLFLAIIFAFIPAIIGFFRSILYLFGYIVVFLNITYIVIITKGKDNYELQIKSRSARKILKCDLFLGLICFLFDPIFPLHL